MAFPTPEEEAVLHGRVLKADPVASADVFAALVEPLIAVLRRDLGCDDVSAWDAAVDAVFEYLDDPTIYHADRGRLGTFLAQIAKRRATDRIRARSAESRREKDFSTLVELRAPAPNEEMERSLDAEKLRKSADDALPDLRDRKAMRLILEGERSTEVLANVLGLDKLPAQERLQEVKRNRDRIMKVLRRIGERQRDGS